MKNEQPEPEKISQILLGVVVTFVWIALHVIYVAFLFVFLLFSNPGALGPSQTAVNVLFYGTCIGLILSALAGFPLGQAMMSPRGKRQPWFCWFSGMFAAGVIIQIGSFVYFNAN